MLLPFSFQQIPHLLPDFINSGSIKIDMGSNAMIAVEQSVADMRKVIAGLTSADTGKFIGNDGVVIPW